jgi:ribonuclease R
MVAMRDLTDDFYDYDEDNYRLLGKRTRKQFQLGDEVKVEVGRADLARRQIDFYLSD